MIRWYLLSVLCVWIVPSVHSLSCGKCDQRDNALECPASTSEQRYMVELHEDPESSTSRFILQCRHNAESIDFSLIADCDFSKVKLVEFHRCPMPNVSFSSIFESLGINPENVTSLSFTNIGQRNKNLEEWHFEGMKNLTILELKDNGFSSVPGHVFNNTPSLKHLMLTLNSIETLPESLFWNTPNLTKLELQNNGLLSLPSGLFANLSNLRNLSLWQNRLDELQPELLSGVPNLWSLELTHNEIKELNSDVFAGLKEIRKILISSNNVEKFHENVFHGCPNLENLEFEHNIISNLPDKIFSQSKKMRRLNLNYNRLTKLSEKLFINMKDLENLKFKRNALSTIPPGLFEGLTKLEVLDFQSNVIEELPSGIFDDLIKLDTIALHNNSLQHLPDDVFSKCVSLSELYLGYNNLRVIRSTMFPNPSVITVLDLSNNNLSFSSNVKLNGSEHITVQEHFPLSHMSSLNRLLLKNNRITEMPQSLNSELGNLTTLDLSNNLIRYLDHNDLSFKSDHVEINLKKNDIKVINLNSMNFSQPLRKSVEIYVAGNHMVCNCELYSLALLTQGKIGHNSGLNVQDASEINCSYPEQPKVVSDLLDLDTSSLTCKLRKCVDNCTCSTRTRDQMFIVDCSYQDLQHVPTLKKKHLPDDGIDYLLTLILQNNSIASLEGLKYGHYNNLVNLTMPYNRLNYINGSYLPDTLQVLDIRSNNLTSLPVSMIEFVNSTDLKLSLGNNPWVCDCDIDELYAFLRDPDRQILDIHNVRCSAFEDEPLINLTEKDFCPLIQQPLVIATITVVGVFLLLFAILGTVSFYRYKQDIKVWLFTHRLCLWAVAEEEQDADKKYDAFISYSNKDEEFVNRDLVPGLESGDPKYKVCLHYRDWVAGEYIQNQIDQSVDASRRTIVVLSSNFIENVWGHLEFKTAHSKALKDRTNRIIVIVLGEVPPESELDEELKLYLSTRTYLEWKDERFWEKLRYAMPHPPDLLRKRNKKQKTIEKLELSKTNGKELQV